MKKKRELNYHRCDGCLAFTANRLCDLGKKTKPVLQKGVFIGTRPSDRCSKISNMEDYLIAHMLNM